ncbi:hypothetical protein ILYODFUR_014700 [Ilyodon furcidens]|uniref:Uncharacterized protein n=1 Tax=Ilyodon furcidens TaxID=33524 RepID=A0ABV0U5G3_9TELE
MSHTKNGCILYRKLLFMTAKKKHLYDPSYKCWYKQTSSMGAPSNSSMLNGAWHAPLCAYQVKSIQRFMTMLQDNVQGLCRAPFLMHFGHTHLQSVWCLCGD